MNKIYILRNIGLIIGGISMLIVMIKVMFWGFGYLIISGAPGGGELDGFAGAVLYSIAIPSLIAILSLSLSLVEIKKSSNGKFNLGIYNFGTK